MVRLFLFLFLCMRILPCQANYLVYPFERAIHVGDNMEWAAADFDHSDWDFWGSTNEIGNFWVRFKVNCDTFTDTFEVPGMQVVSLASYELYWDGQLLGENGKVGTNKATEEPGTFLSRHPIPDSLLTHGVHVVAFRLSNYHSVMQGLPSWNTFLLEDYRGSILRDLRLSAKIFILAGIYLMAGIYYFLLFWLRKREREGLVFSVICFLFFGLIFMEYYKFLADYSYPFHFYRLILVFLLTLMITFLLPYFLLLYFELPHKSLWIALIVLTQLSISFTTVPGFDSTTFYLSRMMWWVSFVLSIYAVWQQKEGAKVLLGAFILSGALVAFHQINFSALLFSYDVNLFLSFSSIVLAMLYLLAKRARAQGLAYNQSLLLSARLQNELLKKNIQPHFIMNTLTSLMEWIEESPKESIQLIEALSKEFEIMSDIAEQQLIPIEQEIALCQQHISIMRFRKEIQYILNCENIKAGEQVPPAIFHTIVENGITHSLPNDSNQVRMLLTYEEDETHKKYELSTFARNRIATAREEGTGLKYIQSRLRESYGEAWKFESYPTATGWTTIIHLFKASS